MKHVRDELHDSCLTLLTGQLYATAMRTPPTTTDAPNYIAYYLYYKIIKEMYNDVRDKHSVTTR